VIDVLTPLVPPAMPPSAPLPVTPPAPPVMESWSEPPRATSQPTSMEFVGAAAGVASEPEVRYYELRIVTFDEEGNLKELKAPQEKIRLDDLDLKAIHPFNPSKLPALFGRLPADRYRIYLIEDGTERLILDFIIQQGQPLEMPETDEVETETEDGAAADPFEDDSAETQNFEHTSFAERLGDASFVSHGGVVLGAAALAYAGTDRWEKSIERLMERFDRRRRGAWSRRTRSESPPARATKREPVHLPL
jgi:hypothetical protein